MQSWSSLVLAALVALPGCSAKPAPRRSAPPPVPPAGPTTQERYRQAADACFDAYLAHHPTTAVELGLHEYDGKLPDMTAAGIQARIAWLKGQEAAIAAFPAAELDAESQVEQAALLAELRGALFELDVLREPFRNPIGYAEDLELTQYIARDYAPLADRARGVMALCAAAPAHLQAAQANLPEAMPRTFVDTALLQVNGMIEFVGEDVATAMTGLDDPDLAGQVSESLLQCGAALTAYRDFLAKRLASANDDFAIGADRFLRMLADREMISIDLARLEQIGRSDLDRNLGGMELAARRLHPRRAIPQILARASADRPAAGKILAEASAQSAAMRQLLIEKDLVSIPAEDVAEVRPSPPFMRWNFAFLSSPGQFEQKPLPSFYYISPPDPRWPRREQKDYIPPRHDLLFTTIHEVWPGHFLEYLHTRRHPSRILRSFCSYSFGEGWAHYVEQMMLEAGAGGDDPRAAIGQLSNALLRNARFVSAIGLHTRGMTVDQAIALFEKKGLQDRASSRQQAVRGTFDPGYLNYTLGKLMILKLREDWKARVGADYSLKAFHDQFLSHGCAPIPAIRRAMLGPDAGPAL
jgi:uncharacterized protein (DUF885 family)